ncbi:MAG: hypothetical protein JWN37_437 [Candidatus Nomurabacteria bacterium]|nr:hypothetical protein [Candidatus Nomurabacteria bacterium]
MDDPATQENFKKRDGIEKLLRGKISEIFPDGAKTPLDFVSGRLTNCMIDAGLDPNNQKDVIFFKGEIERAYNDVVPAYRENISLKNKLFFYIQINWTP